MVVARVSHFDPRCPVCLVGTPGIFTTGAVVPPPYPNPEYKPKSERSQGGQHGHFWYHGTHFSPEEDDEGEPDPVVQEAGGRLRTPDWSGDPGERAHEHWNTDLGVHFSSLHGVAKTYFAQPEKGDIDSRVAHATLHMKNPKHFDSEHDMTHEAIQWAQKNGLHYLPQHHLAHEEFEKGHYAGVADHDKTGVWDEVNTASMPSSYDARHAVSRIDRHGPSWEVDDPEAQPEHKETWLATHPQRSTVTEGYRQHLQSQGHDGVVYGNEHEGPQGHASAIAFPETPVAIHKWEWFHPEHTRPANAQESAEKMRMAPSPRQLKLFSSLRRTSAVRMVPPEEYGRFQYPDYPQAKTPAALARHFKKTSPGYYEDLKRSVQTNGFSTPVLVRWNDPRGKPLPRPQLMSGHHRSAIAHELGMHLPVADYDNHEDFDNAARSEQDWWSQNQRPVGDMPHTGASYTYNQTVMGPEGYEDRVNTVEGPLYHGGRANLSPGEHLTIGRKPNEWGDDAGKSTHNYFTSNPDTAFSYAQQVGRRGRVYEVEPTGEFKMDHSADDFKTKHPVRIVREVPREEWPDWAKKASKTAASDWNFEHFNTEGPHWRAFGGPLETPRQHALEYKVTPEGRVNFGGTLNDFYEKKSGPEAHARMRQNALEYHHTTEHDPAAEPPPEAPKPKRRVYYHGTTMPNVTHILPANHHGGGVIFKNETDKDFAYATPDLGHAWDYAQKASDFTGGRPRVYQVRPLRGHQDVEPDPTWDPVRNRSRGNNETDMRSRHGFEVLREMKAPRHVRESYTDNEWGED